VTLELEFGSSEKPIPESEVLESIRLRLGSLVFNESCRVHSYVALQSTKIVDKKAVKSKPKRKGNKNGN